MMKQKMEIMTLYIAIMLNIEMGNIKKLKI